MTAEFFILFFTINNRKTFFSLGYSHRDIIIINQYFPSLANKS